MQDYDAGRGNRETKVERGKKLEVVLAQHGYDRTTHGTSVCSG
jgi:hypothetical protein